MRSNRVQCPCCLATFDIAKGTKPRSVEQNRRFWAVMHAAFHHWPESHSEQFATMNDLRHWLTMKAGWREEVARIPLTGMKADAAMMLVRSAFAAAGANAWPVVHKGSVVVFRPRSIAFANMRPVEFNALNDAVADVIEAEMHITADDLLNQHERAA